MQSSDPGHYFETDAEQAKKARRAAKSSNKFGNPVILKSKLVAAVVDPAQPSSRIYVAEAAGSVRIVDVNDGSVKVSFRGPTAPLTCVAIGGQNGQTVFAGSWDKTIWSWDVATQQAGTKYIGHSDFVKALVCTRIGSQHVLISGGADKKIIVWDIGTGKRLHTLKDEAQNMMSLQDLAIDQLASTPDEILLVSASSDPGIRRWKIRLDSWEQVTEISAESTNEVKRTIQEHETTVYKIHFDLDSEDCDLWTASGDGMCKCLVRSKGFAAQDTYTHGDHIRAIAITPDWVITAGRDEDIRIWNPASGTLYASFVGHYDEVTDLVALDRSHATAARLCSVSHDGTVRTWPLGKKGIDACVAEQEKEVTVEEPEKKENLMTLDEEAELAALMEDD